MTVARARRRARRAGAGSAATSTPIDDDRCEVRTSDDNLDWLAMRIAMISAPYEVHEPPELIERLRAIADGIARATSS